MDMKKGLSVIIGVIVLISLLCLASSRTYVGPPSVIQGNAVAAEARIGGIVVSKVDADSLESGEIHGLTSEGEQITIKLNDSSSIIIESSGVYATSELNLTSEREITDNKIKLTANLSNGREAEIKIMPNIAFSKAQGILVTKCSLAEECTLILKETGAGSQIRAVYLFGTKKVYMLFGLFAKRASASAEVDAETGEVISVKKPIWRIFAFE